MSLVIYPGATPDEVEWSIGETLITETTTRAEAEAAKARLRLNASNGYTPLNGIVLDESRVDELLEAMRKAAKKAVAS